MTSRRAPLLGLVVAALALAGCGEAPLAPDAGPVAAATAAAVAAPSGLTGTATSPTAIVLTWVDNTTSETGFEIWRSKTGPTGSFSRRTTTAANATGYTDSGTAGTQWCYKVRAVGGAGTSPYSGTVCVTTPLKTPASLAGSASSATVIALTWKDNSTTEAGFEVWRSTSGQSGTYTLRSTVGANSTGTSDTGLTADTRYCYEVRAIGAGDAPPSDFSAKKCVTTAASSTVRLVLFGDSNTDRCEELSPPARLSSYVSQNPRLGPNDSPVACSVAGKIVGAWTDARADSVHVVNHAIASTTTGGGTFGGPNRTSQSAPNARTKVAGITRFQGEVLGKGYPWSGGERVNGSYPDGSILRVNAFVPGPNDFVYVSMGTNDDAGPDRTMTPAQTTANLRYMIEQWTGAGRRADHFILTTLAPRDDANSATSISARNDLIRALAGELGVHLVDLAGFTSNDNGATWKSPSLNIGDGIHYTQAVRAWLADQVVGYIITRVPASL